MAAQDLLGLAAGCFLHMPTGFGQHYGEAALLAQEPAAAEPEGLVQRTLVAGPD